MNRKEKLAAADVLERAGLVLSLPEWWTTAAFARNERGAPILSDEKGAICFCAVGAIEAAAGCAVSRKAALAESALHDAVRGLIVDFNDTSTNTEVSHAMLACAEKLRAEAA